MAPKPLLSICILTYNRAGLLREAINSVLAQLDQGLQEQVELVICDNASVDETAGVVADFQRAAPQTIRYFQNKQNVQFDGNCLLAVERAQGDYVWLLGDDDLMALGALAALSRELDNSAGIDIFLGEKEDFYLTPDRPMRRRRIMNHKQPDVFDFRQPGVLDHYFRLNKKLIAFLNFISIIVFKREQWLNIKQKEAFVGTGYIHVYVLQAMLWGQARGVLKYLPFALAKRRWGTDPNYDLEDKLQMDFQMYHKIAAAVFREKKYIWLIDDLVIRNDGFSWAVRVRIAQPIRFLTKHLPFLIRRYGAHPLLWLKIVPLVLVPGWLLKLMRGLYRKFVKGEDLDVIMLLYPLAAIIRVLNPGN